MSIEQKKSTFIALLGPTNVGKSTLMNNIVGSRISIVTPKVQTTRDKIRAIVTHNNSQMIFIDAPGIFKTKRIIDRFMVAQAWDAVHEADIVMLVVDVTKKDDKVLHNIIKNIKNVALKHVVLVFNKIDLVPKQSLLPMIETFHALYDFKKIFLVSALKNDGLKNITKYLAESASIPGWFYDASEFTDCSSSFIAKEITRKHLLLFLSQELPYELSVEQEYWKENEHSITIHQVIYVAEERHRKIVIGKKGQLLKTIGTKARREIGYLLEKEVNLFLFVKPSQKWQEDFVSQNHYDKNITM